MLQLCNNLFNDLLKCYGNVTKKTSVIRMKRLQMFSILSVFFILSIIEDLTVFDKDPTIGVFVVVRVQYVDYVMWASVVASRVVNNQY